MSLCLWEEGTAALPTKKPMSVVLTMGSTSGRPLDSLENRIGTKRPLFGLVMLRDYSIPVLHRFSEALERAFY